MARIRTIKPEFFRHEALQDLEIANPGMYPLMVFAGLWGHCDSKGRFEWKPRMLKLDILPFLHFDMADTLAILESAGMVKRYTIDGKEYGEVPTFEKHQRLSGKELTEGEKFPDPEEINGEAVEKQSGSVGEIPESQEGKGREGKGKESATKRGTSIPADFSISESVRKWAEGKGHHSLDAHLAKFIDSCKAKGYTYRDWDAAFRNAITDNWAKVPTIPRISDSPGPKVGDRKMINGAMQTFYAGGVWGL